jgi:hypothetical protein
MIAEHGRAAGDGARPVGRIGALHVRQRRGSSCMMEPHELRLGSMMESTGAMARSGRRIFDQPAVTAARTIQEEAR